MTETTIGIIYPDHAAEDEYPWAADLLGVRLPVTHIYGTDLHAVAELLDLGNPQRLASGAAALAARHPDAVMWACTSGSFVYGHDGAQHQVDELSAVAGVPASSTSLAFAAAAHALGIARVAVAASYPDEVALLFGDYLRASGIDVVAQSNAGITTAAEVGRLTPSQVTALAEEHDHPEAEALLIPDTAMRTLDVIPALESRLGKPVLTANQVTIWQGLGLAGAHRTRAELGTLFTRAAAA